MACSARGEELGAVRAELDHLVSIRYSSGFDRWQRLRYQRLLAREIELLARDRTTASG